MLAINAQQGLLRSFMDPLNVKNAKQDIMRSTEPLVTLVLLVLPLFLDRQAWMLVMHAQRDRLLNILHLLNARNVKLDIMKLTEPLVIVVLLGVLLLLDHQALMLVIHVQQDRLPNILDPLNARSVTQDPTKSIGLLVLIVLQDGLQALLGHLNVISAEQALLKSAEPLVLIVLQGPLLELVPQGKPHVKHAQQGQLQVNLAHLNAHNAKQELMK